MNVLTVVSPFKNYRMKLLELMSLTSVSMTLGLGIMDEPDQSSIETDAVSSLSVLIIAVNVVFALCMLFEVMVEVHKKVTKKLRTKELWSRTRQKKDLLIAILMLGSPQCPNSSSDDNSDNSSTDSSSDDNRENSSTESPSLVMAQKRGENALKTKKAEAAEGSEIEMTDLRSSEHGVQAGSLLHMSSLILVVANKAAKRHWQTVRSDSHAIAQIIQLRDVADELIAAAETETENDENAAIIPKRREFSVCKSEPEGETYYVDNTTGERMRELPDDGFISAEDESDLGQAPQTPEDPPCEDTPQRRLHQFSVSVTEDGDKYFTNNETQETVWDLPDGGEVVEI